MQWIQSKNILLQLLHTFFSVFIHILNDEVYNTSLVGLRPAAVDFIVPLWEV